MDTVQTTTARPHIVWLDVLRLVAILMVIAIHCTDPFNASPESRANPEFNFWGSVYGSMPVSYTHLTLPTTPYV